MWDEFWLSEKFEGLKVYFSLTLILNLHFIIVIIYLLFIILCINIKIFCFLLLFYKIVFYSELVFTAHPKLVLGIATRVQTLFILYSPFSMWCAPSCFRFFPKKLVVGPVRSGSIAAQSFRARRVQGEAFLVATMWSLLIRHRFICVFIFPTCCCVFPLFNGRGP